MLSITCHRNPSWRGTNSCLLMLIRTKLWYKQNLRRTGQNLVNNLVQYFIHLPKSIITVWTLQLGHLEEDCLVTTFSENKRFSRFFLANGPIKFKVQLCNYLRKQSSDLWMLLVHLKLLFSENVVIWQSFQVSWFECPHSKK